MDKLIACIYRHTQIYITKELSQLGIGGGQYMVLAEVCVNPGISQDGIAKKLALNKGTVAKVIAQLENGEFITRQHAIERGNTYGVYPTDKGSEVNATALQASADWAEKLTEGMNKSERMLLNSALRRVNDNAVAQVHPKLVRRVRKSRFTFGDEE